MCSLQLIKKRTNPVVSAEWFIANGTGLERVTLSKIHRLCSVPESHVENDQIH